EDDLPLHPLDSHYQLLHCNLALLKAGDKEFQVIEKYFEAAKPDYGAKKILHVWRGQRFKEHDPVDNRKLLWHGTNVAVVAAILKSGLRIMPHSGGRVGRDIYFASEMPKALDTQKLIPVGCAQNIGIMFLNEVALGKEKTITMDDSSLKAPPQGFDSIIARGRQEPDAKHDVKIEIDGRHVIIPQGKPIQTEHSNSSFHQSEYLIYKENQCRIRYLLQIQFN
uniref:Poly [ADP-ribose] polymerase n=1 Tax=Plectus sambesii TaxID=2011161 RepID=A0A914WSW0_9BILA